MTQSILIGCDVNGRRWEGEVDARLTLAELLRENLGLTGTHIGCEQGVCGTCTVLVDGLPARSCLMLAAQADRTSIRTVESLAADGVLHPLQRSLAEEGGLQCGFCTPGLLMTALALIADGPPTSLEEIREALSGNLCRCTGYEGVVRTLARAAGLAVQADP